MDGKFHLHLEVENKDWHENSEVWSFPVNNKIRLGQATNKKLQETWVYQLHFVREPLGNHRPSVGVIKCDRFWGDIKLDANIP